jgi:DNA-binding NtrC family response regulator
MKLLIVDDDSLICSSLARSLIRLGHSARAATSVESACRLLEIESPVAVLTDLDLGAGGDGIDLILRLRREGCRAPTVMMTGSDPIMARARLARAGLGEVALLEKPFAFEDLLKILAEVMPQMGVGAPFEASPARTPRPTPVAAMVGSVVRTLGGRVL